MGDLGGDAAGMVVTVPKTDTNADVKWWLLYYMLSGNHSTEMAVIEGNAGKDRREGTGETVMVTSVIVVAG